MSSTASATHYRYGTLSWEPTGAPNEVRFTGGQAWRASAFGSPSVGTVLQGEGSIATGDSGAEPIYLKVTSVSVVNDYFTAIFVDALGNPGILHTYPAPNDAGAPWVASFSSCCRISAHSSGNFHANNPDQAERLETLVDLAAPSNSAPRSTLPPINPCPRNALCTLTIPFVDAEADPVSFRLSTSAEAGDGNYRPPGPGEAPHAATISAAGVLSWDTTGATVSADPDEHTLYSVQIMLEDGRTKTPLDFFIEIVPPGVNPPHWVTPPTPCGQTLTGSADAPLSFAVQAASADGRPVLLSHLGLPPGATLPVPPAANPAATTLSWTPPQSAAGSHLVVLAAEDDRGYAAPPCAVTIVVLLGPVARAGPGVCAPFGATVTLDGSASAYPTGNIVSYRWDFPHGPSPVHGATIQRALTHPADLAGPYDATLTITTDDAKTATDTVRIHVYDTLQVDATSDRAKYTPFQRPSGGATARTPCGGGIAGTPVEITVTYTTRDSALDGLLRDVLGPDALTWKTTRILDAAGGARWSLPFTVAERLALPLGLLNPMSAFLALQGDYVVEARVTQGDVGDTGSATFDVVVDEQFPLDGA